MKTLAFFLFFSVLIHLTSFTGLSIFGPSLPKSFLTEVAEIDVIETAKNPQKEDEKIFVKQLDSENSLFAQDTARFSSEKTQRVLRETKAVRIGATQNRNNPSLNSGRNFTNNDEESDPDDSTPEFAKSGQTKLAHSTSSLGYTLPEDIQLSETTNLNTDSNIYYSFYDRIDQLVRIRWIERVDYYWNRISLAFKKDKLSNKIWSTTFEIKLKANGEFHSASILRSSGYGPFDESAVYAFKSAGFFPNVPRAKVEPDGFVRLKYRFSIHIGP